MRIFFSRVALLFTNTKQHRYSIDNQIKLPGKRSFSSKTTQLVNRNDYVEISNVDLSFFFSFFLVFGAKQVFVRSTKNKLC